MQATTPPPDSDKNAWRKWLREKIMAFEGAGAVSEAIRREVLSRVSRISDRDPRPLRIASFTALKGEPDLLPLLDEAPQHQWAFPRIAGNDLTFHRVSGRRDLHTGAFGILEPSSSLPVVSVPDLDVILCPGMGFGRDLSRLGRGKGFYDRTLALASEKATIIGIAFSCQVIDSVPTEPHDKRMHALVTD